MTTPTGCIVLDSAEEAIWGYFSTSRGAWDMLVAEREHGWSDHHFEATKIVEASGALVIAAMDGRTCGGRERMVVIDGGSELQDPAFAGRGAGDLIHVTADEAEAGEVQDLSLDEMAS